MGPFVTFTERVPSTVIFETVSVRDALKATRATMIDKLG
jgi:hypothetical protein